MLDFNPSAPLGGNSITGAYVGLLLMTLVLTCGCCCACKCCRTCCSDMLLLVYKVLRWLVMSSFDSASWLYSRGRGWYVSKHATSAERGSTEESCPLECTKKAEEIHNVIFTSPIDSGVGTSATMSNKFRWTSARNFVGNRARATSLTLSAGREERDVATGRTSTPRQAGGGSEVVYANISFIPKAMEVSDPLVRGQSEKDISEVASRIGSV